jgi:hypothetical protein
MLSSLLFPPESWGLRSQFRMSPSPYSRTPLSFVKGGGRASDYHRLWPNPRPLLGSGRPGQWNIQGAWLHCWLRWGLRWSTAWSCRTGQLFWCPCQTRVWLLGSPYALLSSQRDSSEDHPWLARTLRSWLWTSPGGLGTILPARLGQNQFRSWFWLDGSSLPFPYSPVLGIARGYSRDPLPIRGQGTHETPE